MIYIIEWFKNLNPILQGLLATTFTYLVTAFGASLVFFFKNINRKVLDLMMGFAAGVMIAASFWSLLSPAIELAQSLGRTGITENGLGFLFGGLLIIVSDILLQKRVNVDSKTKRSILLTSSVTLHNIPEGMAVGVAFGTLALGVPGVTLIGAVLLALGIGIQNFPEGVCVAMPLRGEGVSRKKAFFIGQASGIVEPIAGVLGVIFALIIQNILPFLLSFSAGAMIAVVCLELVPESFKHNKVVASIGVLVGFIVMMSLDVGLG